MIVNEKEMDQDPTKIEVSQKLALYTTTKLNLKDLANLKMKRFVYTNLQVENVCVLGNWIKLQEHENIEFLYLK